VTVFPSTSRCYGSSASTSILIAKTNSSQTIWYVVARWELNWNSFVILLTMADIISSFPDEILCHILSFLPTKQVVATSVLSKRWNLLWRSIPFFDFHYDGNLFDYDKDKEAYSDFLRSVDSFLLWRDRYQPLHRFRLRSDSTYGRTVSIQTWITAAVSGSSRVQHLDLYLDWGFVLPSVVFTCKTLVVLKLTFIQVENTFSVDLPLLKILHLNRICSSEGLDLSQFLSGCPNLEDLEVKNLISKPKGKFPRLPKLVRANIHEDLLPLEVVKDVEILFLDSVMPVIFVWNNTSHFEGNFLCFWLHFVSLAEISTNPGFWLSELSSTWIDIGA